MENKVKQVTPGVYEIAVRTTCMRHLQVTENCGAITAPLQGCALGHSLTGGLSPSGGGYGYFQPAGCGRS